MGMELTAGAIGLVAIIVIAYLIPTFIAFIRGHHSRLAILATNVLLGWSAIGWIAALIWSLTGVRREQKQS